MVYGNLIKESVDNIDDIIHEFDLFDSIINESNIEIIEESFDIKEKINKFIDMILKWFNNVKLFITKIIRKIKLKVYELFKIKDKIPKAKFEDKLTKNLINNKYTRFKLSNYFDSKVNFDPIINDIKNILDKISNYKRFKLFDPEKYNDLCCINSTKRLSVKDFKDILNKNEVENDEYYFSNVKDNLTEFIENDLEKLLKRDSTGKLIYDAYMNCTDNAKTLTDYIEKFQKVIDSYSSALRSYRVKLTLKILSKYEDADDITDDKNKDINDSINERLKIIKKYSIDMINVIKMNLDCCKVFYTYSIKNVGICRSFIRNYINKEKSYELVVVK